MKQVLNQGNSNKFNNKKKMKQVFSDADMNRMDYLFHSLAHFVVICHLCLPYLFIF